jgi:hypothetical protein
MSGISAHLASLTAELEAAPAMEPTFTAHNDLEEKLVAAQEGRLDSDVFMQQLLDQQLFMPVQDEASDIQGFQRSTRANPLTVEAEDGTRVLVLFTSPERAKPFLQDFPDYGGGLLSEFSWILERIGSGVAIAINPGIEFGIDLESDMVTQLIHLNASRKEQPQASS